MDLAEAHIRSAGYGGFSFRALAAEIGIKSASVHHHFPTKATMAAAVAQRYADRFFTADALRTCLTGSADPMRKRGPFRSLPRSKAAWCSLVPIKITKCSTRPLRA